MNLERLAENAGYFLGRLVKTEEGLEGLKKGFEKFFGEVEEFANFDFSAKIEGAKLVTRSKCPIHSFLSVWCKKYCLPFAKGFAKAYGIKEITRVEIQPESEFCIFEAKVSED